MLPDCALILLALTAGAVSSMEMETVERMVMVRTTGSDLQPAATGYIYKKKNDGRESVIEMGESEVMEQLSKFYEQPKAYAAPIPIKARQAKQDDESNAESKSDERVIPVNEKQTEHADHIDGIADEHDDYKKLFEDKTPHHEDNSFEEYLRKIGHFDDGVFKGYKQLKGADDNDDKYKIYKNNREKSYGGAGSYNTNKFESYTYTGKDKQDNNRNHNQKNSDEHKQDEDNSKENAGGFHKVYNKDDEHKKHGYYGDGDKHGYHKYAYGAGRYGRDDTHGHHGDHSGASSEENANHSAEESDGPKHGNYASNSKQTEGKSFGFEIKH